MISFNDIKNDPGFINDDRSIEQLLRSYEEKIKEQNISTSEKIIELVKEYGNFHIDRIEKSSGDRLRFFFMPLLNPAKYWPEFDQYAVFIGTVANSDCRGFSDTGTIESAYMLNDGCYYNQSKRKIADCIEQLFDYFMRAEYDYHAPISSQTYEYLKKSGWYEGRKVDISALLAECEEHSVTLTDRQKAFFEEFSGIFCRCDSGKEPDIFIYSDGIFEYIDDYDEKWIHDHYDKNAVCVGSCYVDEGKIWLTGDGQMLLNNISGLLKDENFVSPIGRTIMNGFNVLLG